MYGCIAIVACQISRMRYVTGARAIAAHPSANHGAFAMRIVHSEVPNRLVQRNMKKWKKGNCPSESLLWRKADHQLSRSGCCVMSQVTNSSIQKDRRSMARNGIAMDTISSESKR